MDAAGALRHRVAMGTDNGFEIRRAGNNDALGNMVMETDTGRLLGGVGHNDLRAWCYPLNTPRGLGVTQEYAFDHAFHNGVFVAQARVVRGGVLSNFWVVHPDWRSLGLARLQPPRAGSAIESAPTSRRLRNRLPLHLPQHLGGL